MCIRDRRWVDLLRASRSEFGGRLVGATGNGCGERVIEATGLPQVRLHARERVAPRPLFALERVNVA